MDQTQIEKDCGEAKKCVMIDNIAKADIFSRIITFFHKIELKIVPIRISKIGKNIFGLAPHVLNRVNFTNAVHWYKLKL